MDQGPYFQRCCGSYPQSFSDAGMEEDNAEICVFLRRNGRNRRRNTVKITQDLLFRWSEVYAETGKVNAKMEGTDAGIKKTQEVDAEIPV